MAVRLDNAAGGADYYSGPVSVVPGSSGTGASMCMGMLCIFNEDVSGFSLSLDEPTAGANLFHRPRAGGNWRTTYQPGVNNTTTAGSLWSTGAAFQWNGVSVLDEDQHAPWWDTTLHTLSAGAVTAHDENYDTFSVGADSAGGNKIGMDVAEVFILDRVITAEDMALLADGFSPYFFLGNGLVEYWPFHTTGNQVGWVNGWVLTENGSPVEVEHPPIIMPEQGMIWTPDDGGAFTRPLAGALSFSGVNSRGIQKSLAGSLSFAAALGRGIGRQVAGVLSFGGALFGVLSANFTQAVAGALSFSGSTGRGIGKGVAGSLSFAGALGRGIRKQLAGSLSFVGDLFGTLAGDFFQVVAGSLSFTGSVGRSIGKRLAGSLSFVGGLSALFGGAGAFIKSIAGSLSFSGTTGRGVQKTVAGSLSFAGSLVDNALSIAGKTLDALGALLPASVVKLYRTDTDIKVGETVSDASADFSIKVANTDPHYMVGYKDGAPDVAGTTTDDITGT